MKIKICGLSRVCDIEVVNEVKPDYIGFVFAESKRKVNIEKALELRERLSTDIIPVGVFVNEDINNVISIVKNGIIDIIQLHGDEDEEYIEEIKLLTKKTVIKAVSVVKTGDTQKREGSCADYLLFDNKSGGTGQRFDWDLIGKVNKPYFLAGGLDIDNIEEAVKITAPYAVDISSGVETDGAKDGEKIRGIVRKLRSKN